MDPNLIYEKTAAGEEAVRQRTRVVQRNTRMVLILVDGKSTIADLCEKTGNTQLVETALQDLERDGLIVTKLEQDSVWEQSKKLAEEIKAAAVQRLARETQEPPPQPLPEISPVSLAPVPEPFSIAPLSISPHSVFPGQPAPFSTFGATPSMAPATAKPSLAEKQQSDRPGFLSGLLSKNKKDDDDTSISPIRKGPRGPFVSMPLAIALGVVGLLLLVALIFTLYPYDSHRQQIEAALTRLLGQPVRIAEVRAGFAPRPSILLEGVRSEDGAVQAARIRLVPEVFSLLGSHPVFSSVTIESAHMQAKALGVLPKAIGEAMASGASASVRSITFSQLEAEMIGLSVKDLNAEIKPSEPGKAAEPLTFQSGDRSLKIVLKPQAGGFVAEFEGYGWLPQPESRFRFDSVQGQAEWDGRSLAIRSLDVRIFDGAIQGVLLLDSSGQPSLAGDVTVKHMNLQRLGNALGHGTQFEGELVGTLRFSGKAPTWAGVLTAASGDGDFVLQRGVLGNFDLVEAVRRGKGAVRGGATRYEQLSGRLKITPETVRFADLALASGLLRSGGYLEVSRDGKLAGRLDVEMRGSANTIRMPVAASGTLKEPALQGAK